MYGRERSGVAGVGLVSRYPIEPHIYLFNFVKVNLLNCVCLSPWHDWKYLRVDSLYLVFAEFKGCWGYVCTT